MPEYSNEQTGKLQQILNDVYQRHCYESDGTFNKSNRGLTNEEIAKIKECIQNGADVNTVNTRGFSALDYIIASTDNEFIDSLLNTSERKTAIKTPLGQPSLLMLAAESPQGLETVKKLIRNGANVNFVDTQFALTALIVACMNGNDAIVQELLQHTKDSINHETQIGEDQYNALHYAVFTCSTNTVTSLLKHGAKMPHGYEGEYLMFAFDIGHYDRKKKVPIIKNVMEVLSIQFDVQNILKETMLDPEILSKKYEHGITIADIDELSKALDACEFMLEGARIFNKKAKDNYAPVNTKGIEEFMSTLKNILDPQKSNNLTQTSAQSSNMFFRAITSMNNALKQTSQQLGLVMNRKPMARVTLLISSMKDKLYNSSTHTSNKNKM